MALVQNIQQLLVQVSPTGVQILPDGPAEEKWVLRNNGQPGPAEGAIHKSVNFDLLLTDIILYSNLKVWIKQQLAYEKQWLSGCPCVFHERCFNGSQTEI